MAAGGADQDLHIPVLLQPLLAAVSPVRGHWVDGTLGAGGYTRGLIEAGADKVTGIDQDPRAIDLAKVWGAKFGETLNVIAANFAQMDAHVSDVDGVVLDLGVSSMQLDEADRGFSFLRDGPLDMRMSQTGPSAADLVADLDATELANLLYIYGEERASRRIAGAIVKARSEAPITRTLHLAEIIEGVMPRAKPGQSHPATRSFQALRIAVNAEYLSLYEGLMAAERSLAPEGQLAVVTFHSIEDRMVKRFLQLRSGGMGRGSRHAPEMAQEAPTFTQAQRKAIAPDADELAANPRARSAKLRVARRTGAPSRPLDPKEIGMPQLERMN